MAELINKKDAIAIVNSIPCATLEEECTKSVAVGCIVLLPTTTEAEIRAKAYIQFKEKAYKMFSKYNREYGYPSLAECEIVLQEVVDQLKEE